MHINRIHFDLHITITDTMADNGSSGTLKNGMAGVGRRWGMGWNGLEWGGKEHTRAFGKLNLNVPVYFSQIEFV